MDLSDQERALIESVASELDGEFDGVAAATANTMSTGSIEDTTEVAVERFGVDLETASHVATIAMLLISVVQLFRQPSRLKLARESIEQFLDYLMDSPEVPVKARRLPVSQMRKVVLGALKNRRDEAE